MGDFTTPRTLGRTGLQVGRLGLGASYNAPPQAYEQAFERGCNYFYWGASRKPAMAKAIANIIANGKRDELVITVHSYSRWAGHLERSLNKALRELGLDWVDVLLLGYHQKRPKTGVMDRALSLRDKGLVRFVGMSSHNRKLVAEMASQSDLDLFHIRYNAAHRGAEKEVFARLPESERPGVVSFTATRWGDLVKAKRMPEGQPPPPASHCYRFALSHPDVDVCLAGPRDQEQMDEALRTLELGPLNEDEMALMHTVGDHVYKHGNRFFDRGRH